MNWGDIIKRGDLPSENVFGRLRAKLQSNGNSPSGKIEILMHLFEQEGFLNGNSNPYNVAEYVLNEFVHLIDEKDIEQMIDEVEKDFNTTGD
jgi:hypothetical protein